MIGPIAPMSKTIAIVDYGMGNLRSVAHAIEFLGFSTAIARDGDAVSQAAAIVIPGVGAFKEAMRRLRDMNLVEPLNEQVLRAGKPVFGICLGMQLMARQSTEGGVSEGLGWIDGRIDVIPARPGVRLPHVGWNGAEPRAGAVLFRNIARDAHFYFDHSYCLFCDEDIAEAMTVYGTSFVTAIRKDNVFATQFHPEKSQNNGLRVLRNFLNVVAAAA